MKKKPRGRPKEIEDRIEPWQFGRLAIVTAAYDESRERGEKHRDAVKAAVATVRQSSPELSISETGVRRILATYRPRGSGTILRFARRLYTEEDVNRYCWIRDQIAALEGKAGLTMPQLPTFDATGPARVFVRFSDRPDYPRHNRKLPRNNPDRLLSEFLGPKSLASFWKFGLTMGHVLSAGGTEHGPRNSVC